MTPARRGVLADLDRIARQAAATHWSRAASWPDRYTAAWEAAAEAACSATVQPSDAELLRAAKFAITVMVKAERHHDGSADEGSGVTGYGFARFWYQPPLSGWEDAIVDRIATVQIMGALSVEARRAIEVYAGCDGDLRVAAGLAGMTLDAFKKRLGRARREFRVLWHEGESPSRQWGRDRRVYRAGGDAEERVTSAAYGRRQAVNRHRRAAARDAA